MIEPKLEVPAELRDLAEKTIDQAEKAFGSTRCLSHFILGPLSAAQWRRFHLTHGAHHARQITAIRRAHGI